MWSLGWALIHLQEEGLGHGRGKDRGGGHHLLVTARDLRQNQAASTWISDLWPVEPGEKSLLF